MVFASGFLFAGLLTLLFLPALWRRALRLSRRRLEMQMPLSMDEIVAERDQLRAQFAVERRRMEQATETLQQAHAKDMIELGRRAAAMAAFEDEAADLRARLTEALALASDAQTQAAAQLDLDQAQRFEISALETNIEALRLTIADLEGELTRTRLLLEQASAALEPARGEADSLRAQAANLRRASNSAMFKDSSAEGDELLRQAIAELGAEVLRIAGPASASAVRGAQMPGSAVAGSKSERAAAAGE